jgi:hypothetical protein
LLKWQHRGKVTVKSFGSTLSFWYCLRDFFWVSNGEDWKWETVLDCHVFSFLGLTDMYFLQWTNYIRCHVKCTTSLNAELREMLSAFGSVLGRWVGEQTCLQHHGQCDETHFF